MIPGSLCGGVQGRPAHGESPLRRLILWSLQMPWISLFAASVPKDIGHYWGHRNVAVEEVSSLGGPALPPD